MNVSILPFVVETDKLSLDRIKNEDGSYSFRGHHMTV